MIYSTGVLFISTILYSSAQFYDSESMFTKVLIKSSGNLTQTLIIWIIAIISSALVILQIKFKNNSFVFQQIEAIGIPWAFHCILYQIKSLKQQPDLRTYLNILAILLLIIIYYFKAKYLSDVYSNQMENTLMKIKNTQLFQIYRLVICGALSIFVQGVLFWFILLAFNIIITAKKLLNITYLNLTNQFCYLLTDIWAYVSIANLIIQSNESFNPFYLIILVLGYLIYDPPSCLCSLLQQKMQINIELYKQENSEQLYLVLICYYGKLVRKGNEIIEDPLLQKISPLFLYKIQKQLQDSQTIEKYQKSKQQQKTMTVKQIQNQKLANISRYLSDKMIIKNLSLNKRIKLCINIFYWIKKLGILNINHVYDFYYSIHHGHTSHFSQSDKLNLNVCHQLFYKSRHNLQMLNKLSITNFTLYNKLAQQIKEYISSEKSYIEYQTKQTLNKDMNIKKCLDAKYCQRNKIKRQLRNLQLFGCQDIKYLQFQYLYQKYIEKNPYQAAQTLMKRISNFYEKMNNKSKFILCVRDQDAAVFVTTLPNGSNKIITYNKQFGQYLDGNKKKELKLNDLLPAELCKPHDRKMLSCEDINFAHQNQPYYIKSAKSPKIYETSLNLKISVDFVEQLLIVCSCKLNKQQIVILSRQINCNSGQQKLKNILGIKFRIIKQKLGINKDVSIYNSQQQEQKNPQRINDLQEKQLEILAQKNKDKITNLGINFMKYFSIILVIFIFSTLIGFIAFASINQLISVNYNLNKIQNQFYRYILITQVYVPTLIAREELIKNVTPQKYLKRQDKYLNNLQDIRLQFNDMLQKLNYLLEESLVLDAMYYPIDNDHSDIFGYKRLAFITKLRKMQISYQSAMQGIFKSKNQQNLANYIREANEGLHTIEDQDIIQVISSNINQNQQQILAITTYLTYIISTVLFCLVILYLITYFNLVRNLNQFLNKSTLDSQLINLVYFNIKSLQKQMDKLQINQSNIIQLQNLENIQTKYKIKHKVKEQLYDYKIHIYLFTIALILLSAAIIYQMQYENYHPLLANTNKKFKGKLQVARFFTSTIHQIQKAYFESLEYNGLWLDVHDQDQHHQEQKKQQYLKGQTITTILHDFADGDKSISEQTFKNPCDFWIDCTEIIQKYGQQPLHFISIRSQIKVYIDEYFYQLETDPVYFAQAVASSQQIDAVMIELQKIIFVANKIFLKDNQMAENTRNDIKFQSAFVIIGTLLCFIVLLFQFSRMVYNYNKYKEQIYRIVAIPQLVLSQSFRSQINRLKHNLSL